MARISANTLRRFRMPDPETVRRCNANYERAKAEEERNALEKRIKAAKIPPRYAGAKLSDCARAVQEYAFDVEHGGTGWLLLKGANGNGKTHQACAVLNHLVKTRRVEYVEMSEALAECEQAMRRAASKKEVTAHYRNVPVLVIDDLGKEQASKWSLPLMFSIIDGRYKALKPTIVTTNMGSVDMASWAAAGGDETMAKAIISRIACGKVVSFEGKDMRLR